MSVKPRWAPGEAITFVTGGTGRDGGGGVCAVEACGRERTCGAAEETK